jgi:hypothetical protein
MSAEGFAKGISSGLDPAIKYTADQQMERARLLQEDNLARFHEQSEDARQSKQLDTQTKLNQVDIDARATEEAKTRAQNQTQFEQTFHMKVNEDMLGRADQMQNQYRMQVAAYLERVTTNPMSQANYQSMLTLQDQLAKATDPQERAQLQQQLMTNPVAANLDAMNRERINSIMTLADGNPATWSMLAVTYAGADPQHAAAAASQKFNIKPTPAPKPAPSLPPTATPQPTPAPTPSPTVTPSPTTHGASGAWDSSGLGSTTPPLGAGPQSLVTPDMLDTARGNTLGPGNVTAPPMLPVQGSGQQPNDLIPPPAA